MGGTENGAAIQVTPYGSGWAVRLDPEGQPLSIHDSLAAAATEGRRVAAQSDTELVVYGEAWQVLKRGRPGREI